MQIFQLVFLKLFCFRIDKFKKGHLLPSISDPSEDEHNNTNHYHSHHDPKDNQPYGDRWLVRGSQSRLNPQKLQAVVIQLEGIIDTVPGQPIPKAKHQAKENSAVIYCLYHCLQKDLIRLIQRSSEIKVNNQVH